MWEGSNGQKIDKKASNVRDLHELFKIWIRPSLGVCLACSVQTLEFQLTRLVNQCVFESLESDSEPRTATEMDGTLHTDFRKSKTNRDIKKYF